VRLLVGFEGVLAKIVGEYAHQFRLARLIDHDLDAAPIDPGE
jgi:hypothetical protein